MSEPVKEQITQFAKDERGVSKVAVGLGVAALATAGIGVGAVVSNRGHEQTQVPATPTPLEAAATPKATDVIATPTGTFKVEVPPSPETQPCQIFSKELCAQGELLVYKTPQGQEIKYMGWNLPEGTEIKSPIDGFQFGKVQVTQPSAFQGTLLSVGPADRSINYNFTGDLKTPDNNTVQKDKVLATIGNTNAKEFGSYNLILTITRIDPTTKLPVTDEATLKKLFPKAFDKPAKSVSYAGPITGTVTAPEYYTKP